MRIPRCLPLALFLVLLSTPGRATGPESDPEPASFAERTRVTAVDMLVALEGSALERWGMGDRVPDIEVGEVAAWVDGVVRPVVAVEPVRRGRPEGAGDWHVEVVLDARLSSRRTLRAGASLLTERLQRLVELGSVTLVSLAADDEVRVLADRSRDVDRLREILSSVALRGEAEDALRDGRWRWLSASGRLGDPRRADAQAAREVSLVRAHLDRLVPYLVERARAAGPRRLLLWLGDGFDLDPRSFYAPSSSGESESDQDADERADAGALREVAESTARILAAHGWVTLALSSPPADPFRGKASGWRVGKWRILGLFAVREAERDPEKSEGLIQVGDQKMARGDAEGAAEAYDRAWYHFWGDPRTKDRQVVALVKMAEALAVLGEEEDRRNALSLAAQVDPATVAAALGTSAARPVGRLLAPSEPLTLLADASAGWWLDDTAALDEALRSLDRRLRVTVQVDGAADGALHPIEVEVRGAPVPAPGWIRRGQPLDLTLARLRRALRETPEGRRAGSLPVSVALEPIWGEVRIEGARLRAELPGDPATDDGWVGPLRWSVVRAHGERLLVDQEVVGESPSIDLRLDGPWDGLWVVVDDLGADRWGASRP